MIPEDPSNMSFEDSMELARQFCDPPVPYWDELRVCKACGRDDAEGVCQCWNDE